MARKNEDGPPVKDHLTAHEKQFLMGWVTAVLLATYGVVLFLVLAEIPSDTFLPVMNQEVSGQLIASMLLLIEQQLRVPAGITLGLCISAPMIFVGGAIVWGTHSGKSSSTGKNNVS